MGGIVRGGRRSGPPGMLVGEPQPTPSLLPSRRQILHFIIRFLMQVVSQGWTRTQRAALSPASNAERALKSATEPSASPFATCGIPGTTTKRPELQPQSPPPLEHSVPWSDEHA